MQPFLIAAVCGLAVSAACAAEEPGCSLVTEAIPYSTAQISLFRHGYLVLWPPGGFNGVSAASVSYGFDAYGRDGKLAYKKTIDVPGGSQLVVYDVDFDADGNAAVAASALGGTSQFLHVIILLDRNGNQTGLIDTGRYLSAKIAVAEDRSIWALGWQRDPVRRSVPDSNDYMIVRHFSWEEGKELGAYVARSTFPKGLEPGAQGGLTHIMVTKDRVGIFAVSGNPGNKTEWLELDLDGNVIERSRLDNVLRQVFVAAFTEDDYVYLGGNEGLYTLDHSSHMWKPTSFTPNLQGRLMGPHGYRLVCDVRSGIGPIELQCFDQPEPR